MSQPLDERHCQAAMPGHPSVLCGLRKGHDIEPDDTGHRQRWADGGNVWGSALPDGLRRAFPGVLPWRESLTCALAAALSQQGATDAEAAAVLLWQLERTEAELQRARERAPRPRSPCRRRTTPAQHSCSACGRHPATHRAGRPGDEDECGMCGLSEPIEEAPVR